MKKIVIIPDSFKGTISSQEAGRIIEEEAKRDGRMWKQFGWK